jgi:hypothetical protein
MSGDGSGADQIPGEERLQRLRRLEADWDDEGGRAPSALAIKTASQVIRAAERLKGSQSTEATPYDVSPVPSGGVMLEWRSDTTVLQLEVGCDGKFGYLLVEGQGASRKFTERENVASNEMIDLLGRVLSS